MSIKEITTIECGRYRIVISGSDLLLRWTPDTSPGEAVALSFTRQEARDLSKAFSIAADIVKTQRKPSP